MRFPLKAGMTEDAGGNDENVSAKLSAHDCPVFLLPV